MNPESFITAYQQAIATQQWANVEPLIHPNACVTFSNGQVHKGIQAIQQAYTNNFTLIKNEEYTVSNIHWVLNTPLTAVYLFTFSWQGLLNGKPASGKGTGTAVLAFGPNGWQLMAEHLGPAA